MKVTIGKPREITLDIHLRPDSRHDGALEVYVDDWPWDGPHYSIEKAIDRLHEIEAMFRERAALENINMPEPQRYSNDFTFRTAIYQRLHGQRAHDPWEN